MNMSLEDRLARHTPAGDADHCWEWQGTRTARGYGQMSWQNRSWLAHRLVWTAHHGDIPIGLSVCHHCNNAACVNPAHLFLSTDDGQKERAPKARGRRRAKDRCVNGHPFDEANTGWWADGRRHCRACHRETVRKGGSK